jgi:hypothetical protein
MKKKINKALLVLSFLSLAFYSQPAKATTPIANDSTSETTRAQAEPGQMIVVADVNFRNPILLKQEGNKLELYFRLENNLSESEAGIRYGVRLVKDNNLADEKVYTEDILSVEGDSSIQKMFSYEAPAYLAGDFELWLVAKNESGLPLSTFKLEKLLTLQGDGGQLEVDQNSCALRIDGEAQDKKYALAQGVSLKNTETLKLSCDVTSHFKEARTIYSTQATFYRSAFGEQIGQTKKEDGNTFQAGEKKTITIAIEKPTAPQAYDAIINFYEDNNNSQIGNQDKVAQSIDAHFVIIGESATIQKLDLDKISYQKNNVINANLHWNGSTDNFDGSQIGSVAEKKVTADLTVTNQANQLCAQIQGQALDQNSNIAKFTLKSNIDCFDPNVKIALKDEQGKVLAERSFHFQKDKIIQSRTQQNNPKSTEKKAPVVLVIVLLSLLVFIVTRIFFSFKKNKTEKILSLLFLLGALFGWRLQSVEALTLSRPFNSWGSLYYSVNLNKGIYNPGEAIIASYDGTATNSGCFDHDGNTTLLSLRDASGNWNDVVWRGNQNFRDGNCVVTIPAGTYSAGSAPASSGSISFRACITGESSGGVQSYCFGTVSGGGNIDIAAGDIPYTVADNTPDPICNINFGSSSYVVHDTSSLAWSSNATGASLFCSIGGITIINGAVPPFNPNLSLSLDAVGTASCVLTVTNGSKTGICNTSTTVTAPPPVCVPTCNLGSFHACLNPGDPRPANSSEVTSESCCDGKKCYGCSPGYIWNVPLGQCLPVANPVDGECGSLNGTISCTQPPATADFCRVGVASTVAGSGPWIWTCAGSNGGNSVSCSVAKSCGGPACTASFFPARITSPASSDLTWSVSSDTTSMTFSCTEPIPVPSGTAVSPLNGGPVAIPFSTPGTETCTFIPYTGTTPGPSCVASVVIDPLNVPNCTASFSPTSITIPGSSDLEWHSSANTTSLITFCTGPIPVPSMSTALNGGPAPIPFTTSGTETCTFTPYAGATAGAPCEASVYAGCECSLVVSGGASCSAGTTCDGCYCIPDSAFSCLGNIPVGSVMCPGSNVGLAANLTWAYAGTTAVSCGVGKCRYYTPTTYSCTGSIPGGSTMCPGSNLNLSLSTPWSSTGGNSLASCVSGEKCKYYSCPGTICSPLPACGAGTACGTYHQSCLPAPSGCPSCPAGSCTGSITCPCNSGGWQEIAN